MSLTRPESLQKALLAPCDAMTIQTNMTTAKLHYLVSCDHHPFRWWSVTAESEIEARMIIATDLGVGLELMEAKLAPLEGSAQ